MRSLARQENGFSKQKALARHGVSPAVATLSPTRLFSGTKACCPALLLSPAQSATAHPPFPLHARRRDIKPHQATGYAAGKVDGTHGWVRSLARQENGFSKQKALARHDVSPAVATLSPARLFSGTKACCPALLLSPAQSAAARPPFPLHARQREMKPHQATGYAVGKVDGRHGRVRLAEPCRLVELCTSGNYPLRQTRRALHIAIILLRRTLHLTFRLRHRIPELVRLTESTCRTQFPILIPPNRHYRTGPSPSVNINFMNPARFSFQIADQFCFQSSLILNLICRGIPIRFVVVVVLLARG
ncbi:hypothetical protein Drorol1_Dr00016442 [Drosera rotundifolia]